MSRGQNKIPSNISINENIANYTAMIQKSLAIFYKGLKKIIKYNVEIDKSKSEIYLNQDRDFSILFEDMTNNGQMIPS